MPELDIGASQPLREEELVFRYTRSGGAGGQHVNTSSRHELDQRLWDQ